MLDNYWTREMNFRSTREATFYLFKNFFYLGLQKPKKWKILYYLYAVSMIFIVCFLLPIMFVLSTIFEYSKMPTSQLLTSLQVAINCYGLPVKFITIFVTLKLQSRAMDIMDILDAKCQRPEERELIRHCAVIGNRLTTFYIIFYGLCSVLNFVTALIVKQPPYSLYMPVMEWRNSAAEFVIQSFIEFNLMNVVILHQAGYDVYAVIYVYIMRTHMKLLVGRVRRLGTDAKPNNDEHYKQLVECIKDHQNLLRLVELISPIISITIFTQFTITGAILGTTLINILLFADTSAQVSSVVYFLAVLFETAPCCYQAACLILDCEQLSLAIFHCEWLDKDIRFRKTLRFFMMRSQVPIKLRAMKLFPINLETSLAVVKFSFSLYTLMKHMEFGQTLKH